MAKINRIDVRIYTSSKSGAGTDGDVFLGIAGREFNIDSTANDFERNTDRTYTLGSGANIKHAARNNPRVPQLRTGHLGKCPIYIRFEPKGAGPNWSVEYVRVTVNPGPNQIRYKHPTLDGSPDMWLGQNFGKMIYLLKY